MSISSVHRSALAVGISILTLGLGAGAARAAADITGMWQYDFSLRQGGQAIIAEQPSLTDAAKALQAQRRAARLKGYVRELGNMKCLPTGTPQLMTWRSPLEIMQGFGRISIITEHDPGNDEPRTIYLNESKHPDDVAPSWNGHSIGHWEGKTLVVDTVGFNERANLLSGVPRSPDSHLVERFHLTKGGKVLLDDLTMSDPQSLTKPWTVTLTYNRMPASSERLEAVCEPDLDALQKVDVDALKAFDVEAQRMTDPSQRYNPGGK